MITLNTLGNIFLISATVIGIIFLYFYWVYNYSKNNHVPLVCKPTIPYGSIPLATLVNKGFVFKEWYLNARSRGYKIVKGFISFIPFYIVVDLQYIKYMLQKDFDHFNDRGLYGNGKKDPLSANLATLSGKKWSFMRSKLSPCFTSGKIKKTFDTLLQCGYQLEEALENKQVIHLNELAAAYTVNVIGSYSFGIDCNSFKDPNMEFKRQGEKLMDFGLYRNAILYLGLAFPNLALKLGARLITQKSTDFFIKIVKEVIEHRVKNNVRKNDMLQSLMDVYKKDENSGMDQKNSDDFNYVEITAQAIIFFGAGFDSSADTITHCLYEISLNEDIQKKLRDEVHQVLQANDGKITYDALMDMKYMNQVIDETLRKYPPLMYNFRKVVKDYTFPDTDIKLPTNTIMIYSILGVHHDPQFYPEPEKFDPERFSTENKKRIPAYAFLPFGEGPRICIAARLGITQVQVALVILLKTYKVSLNEKTKLPLQYKTTSLTYEPSTQIYLNIEKIAE